MRGSTFGRRAAAALIAISVGPFVAAPAAGGDSRPNIVVFYMDDVSPHDGRLWADPERTPNLHEQFVAHGVEFDHAIGETPRCCPARANTLTGIHTQSTGVTENDVTQFDPSVHVGSELKKAGYASMFIGKYLNANDKLDADAWRAHQTGWTALDAIYGKPTFEDYVVRTKEGNVSYPETHSTQMIADRAVARFSATPSNQPIFAMLSFYDLHGPNHPQAEFVGDSRCADMSSWDNPAYNEADVSDKPPAIRALPRLPYADGWPMVTYCEEMLGVDRSIGQILDELRVEGRLANTVLVFTADNGTAWGMHRLGQKKLWPYTTPLPMYVRWPAGNWGDQPSTISEVVSNIDLAPTFCELGGCALGPYAHGKAGPDGVSLVGLLDGAQESLGRDAVLENHYGAQNDTWAAVRTTSEFDSEKRWHYVEYGDGFTELYELESDPWELDNRAEDPNLGQVVKALHDRLEELRSEGIADGTGSIRIVQDSRPNDALDFDYTGDLGGFTLDDDADSTNDNAAVFSDLDSGVYTIRRTHEVGPPLAELACSGGVTQPDVETQRLSVYLRPGDDVVCTWIDGRIRADASIALSAGEGPFKANDLYQRTPTRKQTAKRLGLAAGTFEYRLKVQNDGLATDSFALSVGTSGPDSVAAVYSLDGEDVTADVASGGFVFENLSPRETSRLTIQVVVPKGTPAGSTYRQILTISSVADPARVDSVRLVATTQ